jgi:hypothetical protein
MHYVFFEIDNISILELQLFFFVEKKPRIIERFLLLLEYK